MKYSTEIVIPTYNQEHFTVKCLQSIRQYTSNYRVIWVDNGSSHTSRETVLGEIKNHANRLIIWLDKNYGFVKAVNIGIDCCQSPFIVLQNNDTEVTPQWLERLMRPMFDNEKIMASGPMTDAEGSWQGWRNVRRKMLNDMPDLNRMNAHQISETLYRKYPNKHVSVQMIAFFSALFRREVFDKMGGLDDDMGIGFADDDLMCFNIRKNGGLVVLVPSAFVYHHHRTTFKSLFTQDEIKKMQEKNLKIYKNKCNLL